MEIRFGETIARLSANQGFAHFYSSRQHKVVNTGHTTAEFLVLRNYDCGTATSKGKMAE
jgi:hypothetical protein